MRWLGKVIGAIVGWVLTRHPLGILLGVSIGHMLDISAFGGARSTPNGFVEPLFGFLGALTKADGRVSEAEIAATERLMARMQLDAEQRRLAIIRFNLGKQAGFPVNQAIVELKTWSQSRRDHAYILLDLVLDIVGVDGPPVAPKLDLLRKLAWALSIHEREWIALAAAKGYAWAAQGGRRERPDEQRHAPPPQREQSLFAPDPYDVLGVSRDAGEREIKRAYRKLMSEHHPDKLGDTTPTLRAIAEERSRDINAAYEKIKAAKGFK